MTVSRLISVQAAPLVGGYATSYTPIITDGKLQLVSSTSAITFDMPIRPYKSTIRLNIDIAKANDNTYKFYDNGQQYDSSFCECTVVLNKTQARDLDTFLREYRNESYTLNIIGHVPSGFYPFLPHRGNTGPFVVSCEVENQRGMVTEPFRYFGIDLKFTNVGTYPSYTLPAEHWEGDWALAGIDNLRFPDELTSPRQKFSRSVIHDEKSYPYYDTGGPFADSGELSLPLKISTGKAAALLDRLTTDLRATSFSMATTAWQFPFGEHYDDAPLPYYQVKMIQSEISMKHDEFDVWSTDINLLYEALV